MMSSLFVVPDVSWSYPAYCSGNDPLLIFSLLCGAQHYRPHAWMLSWNWVGSLPCPTTYNEITELSINRDSESFLETQSQCWRLPTCPLYNSSFTLYIGLTSSCIHSWWGLRAECRTLPQVKSFLQNNFIQRELSEFCGFHWHSRLMTSLTE